MSVNLKMKPKSRKEEYAEATRSALMDAALDQFIEKGYAKTSVEDIVRRARVTRGALYHHFSSKEEIFIRVYKQIIDQMIGYIDASIQDIEDPWEQALAGCKAFLDYCVTPKYKSIRLDDAIGILGWKKWREIDSSYTMQFLRETLAALMKSGGLLKYPVAYVTNLLYAMLVEAAMTIAAAEDKQTAHDEMYEIIKNMLTGLGT